MRLFIFGFTPTSVSPVCPEGRRVSVQLDGVQVPHQPELANQEFCVNIWELFHQVLNNGYSWVTFLCDTEDDFE